MVARIELAERATLPSMAHWHGALGAALARPEPVEIDASRLVEGDLALLQLIAAARAEAAAGNREMSLTAPANPALLALLDRCGMTPTTPADAAFWLHGEIRP